MLLQLTEKWQQSPDSWKLRFALPPNRTILGNDPFVPTCVSVKYKGVNESGEEEVLKKSYSPISHPSTEGVVDFLVKEYPPRPGGGVGAYICSLTPGESLTASLKAERMMHGSPVVSKRWKKVGLVGGGTGVAPLIQIVRILLDDPEDDTTIQFLSINRKERDILMKNDLDQLVKDYPGRFSITYSLTDPPENWNGEVGRGTVDMIREALPEPAGADGSTMILVCGMDGFVESWAGPVGRAPPLPDGSKGPKIQGPLLGLLADAGYDASEVFKY
uniref:NADH-cytochrome b5 reductase n=1 Tax=Ditylum brightwellii TaxID=49249 RepID=A0A6V2A9H5_9STRA|mmetsp:Transcript_35057/g.52319  ORF Transcript_35057/g.52319 Transcript_35057/m.52319 type:complete len:274 (-) Transcript_35057:45-866(-)